MTAENGSEDCLDLTVKDVCFNCNNGFVLGNRKQLSLYSHLLRVILEKCPNIGSKENIIEKKCVVLNGVMCEDLELLFMALNKNDPIATTNNKIEQIRHAANNLGMKLEEESREDGFRTFKILAVNSETEDFKQLIEDFEIKTYSHFTTIERNEATDDSYGIGKTPLVLEEHIPNLEIEDICFNCCDGVVNGNREQLSLYSLALKQIFRDYPSIANDVSTAGIGKGIFLSNSYSEDVRLLFQTISKKDYARVSVQKIARIRNVAQVLGMKLNEFPNSRGSVWFRVAKVEADETGNLCPKFDITEITHNKYFEKIETPNDFSANKKANEEFSEKDSLDLRVKDICFNCENGPILANRRQLTIYSAFLKQLFEEFPNIAFDNSLSYDKRGINLPSIRREDIEVLLQAINKHDVVTVLSDRMASIRYAASMLQINIHEIQNDGAFVDFKLITANSVDLTSDMWNTTVDSVSNDVYSSDIDIVTNTLEESKVCVPQMAPFIKKRNVHSGNNNQDDSDGDCKIIKSVNVILDNEKIEVPKKYIGKARRSVPFKVKKNEVIKQHQCNGPVKKESKVSRLAKNTSSKIRCKCGKRFDNSVYFYKHRVHCDYYRRDAIICEICDNPFKNQFSLKIHKSRIHKGEKTQNECCCGEVFNFKGTLRNHQQTCDIFRRTALHCSTCDLYFHSQNEYFIHTNSRAHLNKNNKRLEINF